MTIQDDIGVKKVSKDWVAYAESLGIDKTCNIFEDVLVGVEVEVEKAYDIHSKLGKLSPIFYYTEDHSLRNGGIEILTRPIPAKTVVPAYKALIDYLETFTPEYEFSKRTSLHLHFNMQDYTVTQVRNILFVYILFERHLFKYVCPLRRSNIFCIPLQETKVTKELIDDFYNCTRHGWGKYAAVNTLPLFSYGTLEFRLHEGTNNVNKVANWLYILLSIITFAVKQDESLYDQICGLNTNSMFYGFANAVFGNYLGYLDGPNFVDDMVKGIKHLKGVYGNTNVWNDFVIFIRGNRTEFRDGGNIKTSKWTVNPFQGPPPLTQEEIQQMINTITVNTTTATNF